MKQLLSAIESLIPTSFMGIIFLLHSLIPYGNLYNKLFYAASLFIQIYFVFITIKFVPSIFESAKNILKTILLSNVILGWTILTTEIRFKNLLTDLTISYGEAIFTIVTIKVILLLYIFVLYQSFGFKQFSEVFQPQSDDNVPIHKNYEKTEVVDRD